MAPKQVKVNMEIVTTEEEPNEVVDPMAVSNPPNEETRRAKEESPDEDVPDLVNNDDAPPDANNSLAACNRAAIDVPAVAGAFVRSQCSAAATFSTNVARESSTCTMPPFVPAAAPPRVKEICPASAEI